MIAAGTLPVGATAKCTALTTPGSLPGAEVRAIT